MKKKVLSLTLAAAMLFGTMPITGLTETASADTLNMLANRDIFTEQGEALLDDTYQYCVENDAYFAYMWVPETAQHLNGVMVAKSNLIEARLMQSKTMRDVLAKYNIGIVYWHVRDTTKTNTGAAVSSFDYRAEEDADYGGGNAGAALDEMMARFAAVSGYDELRYTPFIGVGHSAAMAPGKTLGSWDPARTIAQICMKCGTGLGVVGTANNYDVQPGVPTYIEAGQFTEHAGWDNVQYKDNYIDGETTKFKNIRANGDDRLVTMSVEWESGHYDWSEQSNEMLAAYLDAVIPARLGAQAESQDRIAEDYKLADLTDTGYVSDIEMLGTRTAETAEDTYAHGDVTEFDADDRKNMIWFPNEGVYQEIRNFTNDRKDTASATETPEDIKKTVFASYETQFSSSTGEIKSGNYIRYDNNIMFVFDTNEMSGDYPVGKAVLSFNIYHGNTSRSIKLTQYNEAQDGETIAIPSDENSTVVNAASDKGAAVSIDVTSAVQSAISEGTQKVYFALSITDAEKAAYDEGIANGSISNGNYSTSYGGFGFSGSDIYLSTTAGVTEAKRPQINITDTAEPTEAPIDTKHQYLLLEDVASKTPKAFTRITRYDAVNPNDGSYADGLANDPMSFSMYVDKLNVVSPDHIGAGSAVRSVSDTPAVITPVMAPVEWIGVEQAELTESDIENHVASKWRNVLRWKNNRLYYRMSQQDSYLNLNTFDVRDENGGLEFAYATNTFQVYPPYVSGANEQHITMPDVADVRRDFTGFTITPESSADLPVDVIVEYGPVKAVMNADGSYTVKPDQIPAGAQYPIECKLVASQFGVNHGNKINTAEPVEKIFYITDDNAAAELPLNGAVNQNSLLATQITGFNVEGSGTITLKLNTDTAFNAKCAAERNNAVPDSHYRYPADYNPYDHWLEYPSEWTAEVTASGFVPLSAFMNGDQTNINLRYLNEIASEGITSITPVTNQTEVPNAQARQWGNGVNIVWQKPQGDAFDSVKIYIKNADGAYTAAEKVTLGAANALVTGLDEGEYTFKIATVKNGIESAGVEINGAVDGVTHMVEDFEAGDLTSGMNVLSGQETPAAYAWETFTGAVLMLHGDRENHYLGMQNTYTSSLQTVNINIPGGLTADMTELRMDILVDKLENSYPAGQVYIELFNPTTGKSYGIEKGGDFALEDKDWHKDYTIKLSAFNLPTDEETLSQITVLKVGRKTVGGGNNNRRGKIYLDNIKLLAEEPIKTAKLILSADNVCDENESLPYGAAVDAEKVNYLFDGDTSDTNLYTSPAKKFLYLDLGAEYQISRIVVTDYTTKGTLMAGGSNTDPATVDADDARGTFATMIRTNGSTQNGITSSYEDIKDSDGNAIGRTAAANDIYSVSGFEKIRYICLYDWSNAVAAAELEIYVVDDGTVPIPTEQPASTPTPTPAATEQPTPTPTSKPTEEPEFGVKFDAAEKTDHGIKVSAANVI